MTPAAAAALPLQAVAVLQCLQRLAAQPLAAEGILSLPGAVARIFAALACSVDHIVFEAARLLTRLWSPAAGRRGAGGGAGAECWQLLRLQDGVLLVVAHRRQQVSACCCRLWH